MPSCEETRGRAVVLFRQFETIAYTKSEFLLDAEAKSTNYHESENDLRFPFMEFMGGLRTLGRHTETTVESSYSEVLVGAKNFVMPEGLGMVGSNKCYIAVGGSPDIKAEFQKATQETIDGKRVWTWTMAPDESFPKKWTRFFAAQIQGYFVMTNNRADFEKVAAALLANNRITPSPR